MSKAAKHVIIGNSAAAVGAVAGIRSQDQEAEITIISQEKEHTYSRPLITYLLGGKVGEETMHYRPLDFYEKKRVKAMLGQRVGSVDAPAKKVVLESGEEAPYDKLLLSTGGNPIVPPDLKGSASEGVFTFTTWQDARDIKNYIQANQVKKAVVVGGGLIGLKSVEALVSLGMEVKVVELAPRILAITLDDVAGKMAVDSLERSGVELITERTVSSILAKDGKVSAVTLNDDTHFACGLVILAIGVRPRVELAHTAGLSVDRGIIVDDAMRTSDRDIFAAGDAAQALEILSGKKMPIPIWPVAYRQGFIAGANMAGGDLLYEGGLAMNSVEICGLPTISAGITTPEEGAEGFESLSVKDEEAGHYKKLVLRNNRLVGAVFVGDIDRAGIIIGLIRSKMKVAALKDKLLGDDFGLITLPPSYRDQVQSGKGVVTL